jgi:hypothetical protein
MIARTIDPGHTGNCAPDPPTTEQVIRAVYPSRVDRAVSWVAAHALDIYVGLVAGTIATAAGAAWWAALGIGLLAFGLFPRRLVLTAAARVAGYGTAPDSRDRTDRHHSARAEPTATSSGERRGAPTFQEAA